MGTRLVERHTARGWQQTDQVRVWTVATLLSSTSSSTARSSRRKKRRRSILRPNNRQTRPFGLKCFKAKAHTGLSRDQEQQLWRFPAQRERERVRFSLQTDLTFIYMNHSSLFTTSTWARPGQCNTRADIYSTQTHNILQQSLVMIVKVQCVAYTCDEWKENSWQKRWSCI